MQIEYAIDKYLRQMIIHRENINSYTLITSYKVYNIVQYDS